MSTSPTPTSQARSSDRSALLYQYKDGGTYHFTGDPNIDPILIGSKWTLDTLTYSFPTSGSFYEGQGYDDFSRIGDPAFHVPFNAQQQDAARYAYDLVASYTGLKFQEITETADTHADLRLSQTRWREEGSAHGYFPSSLPYAGDIWFGTYSGQPFYQTPAKGNWGQATMMHEIGHTLGLKHGHQDYTNLPLNGYLGLPTDGTPRYGTQALPADHDGQDWSLMSYRSDPTNPGAEPPFEGDGFNQPQTFMQDDIAALQFLYGANFGTHSGDTVYTWSTTTGEMSIDGVGQGAPTANKISMTLWDGNGIDTYDLSNYRGGLRIDLRPGAFSTFSTRQLTNHQALSHGDAPAVGNVANALLYQEDARSLIENAVGGRGNDRIIGNAAANRLDGGIGADRMAGLAGNDTYVVDDRRDRVSEKADAGFDRVLSSVSYTLSANVEDLTLIGGGAIDGSGNGLGNLLTGNAADNILRGKGGDDRLEGGGGDDELLGGWGSDTLNGGTGDDKLVGWYGDDSLYGGGGADWLIGGAGDDYLAGGTGADRLEGSAGDDILEGNGGADLFVFETRSGADDILGFNVAAGDRIGLSGQSYQVSSTARGNALLTLSGGGTVTLAGVTQAEVNASFFV